MMTRMYPNAESCYRFLGGFRGSVSTGGGIATTQWHRALQELFRMAKAPPPTSELSLAVFKDVTKNQSHPMSFAAFENAFFFKSSPSSCIWPVGPGAQNRAESMRAGGGGGQEVHYYQQRRGESSSVPGSLLSAVKLLADRAGQVNAACFAISGGGARLKRGQFSTALIRAGVNFEPHTLQAILDYAGQGSGAIDVERLLRKCCTS